MGTAAAARIAICCTVAGALAGSAIRARAESRCTGATDDGARFPTCFDRGNRLYLIASTDGYGGGIALRHVVRFEDAPDLIWKLEHHFLDARGSRYAGTVRAELYSGRFLRHSRDGHVVLPFSVGRKIFLPFDIGADASVARVIARLGAPRFRLSLFEGTALIDVSRSADFRRRLCVGALLSWEVEVARDPLAMAEHEIAPFTAGVVDAHAESGSGLTAADLRLKAGRVWSNEHGWRTLLSAKVSLERVLVAINDRPLSVVLGASYRGLEDELRGQIGLEWALFQRTDSRVVLDPLRVSASR